MGIVRARHVLAGFLVLAASFTISCSVESPPAQSPPPPGVAQSATYQQRAGYGPTYPEALQTATAPHQYPPAPGGFVWPNFADQPAADVAGLSAQLGQAEQAVDLALGLTAPSSDSENRQRPAPATSAVPGGSPPVQLSQMNACAIACAALASMRRSAEHICGMVGQKDSACDGARDRVQRAEQRVTATCPACAAKP